MDNSTIPRCIYTAQKIKGAHTLWQIAVKMDIAKFDNKIQKN